MKSKPTETITWVRMTPFDTRFVVLSILAVTFCLNVGTGHPQNIPPPARYSNVRNPVLLRTSKPPFATKTNNERMLDEINIDVTPSIPPWFSSSKQRLQVATPTDSSTGDDLYFDGYFKNSSKTKQEARESTHPYPSQEELHLPGSFNVKTRSVKDSIVKMVDFEENLDFLRRDSELRHSVDYTGSLQMVSSSRKGVKGGRSKSSAIKESTLNRTESLPQTSAAGGPCDAMIEGVCFKWGPSAMDWEAAQQYCRSEGGFLTGHQHLMHLQEIWHDRNGAPSTGETQVSIPLPDEDLIRTEKIVECPGGSCFEGSGSDGDLASDAEMINRQRDVNRQADGHPRNPKVEEAMRESCNVTGDLRPVVIGVVPSFLGNSYLSLPTLSDAYLRFDMEVSFKPLSEDGIILYNSRSNDKTSDCVAFGLQDGFSVYQFDVGAGAMTLKSLEPLALNKWHTVKLSRNRKTGSMSVNGGAIQVGNTEGRHIGLELLEPLFVGGVPERTNLNGQANFTRGFRGCISRLVINGSLTELLKVALERVNVEDCNTCGNNPCQNNMCQESYTEMGYHCICSAEVSTAGSADQTLEQDNNETLTWTGLTRLAGHHQWLTHSPGYARFTEWASARPGQRLGPWMDGCPALGLSSASFHLPACFDRLRFACILSPQAEAKWSPDDVELRVSHNGSSENTWLELREQDFNRALLSCNWYNRTSRLKLQLPQTDVFWVKDGVFLEHNYSEIHLITLHDPTKSMLLPDSVIMEDKLPTLQGEYWCEAWLPNTNRRLASKKMLVTVREWQTFVLSIAQVESSEQDPNLKALMNSLGFLFQQELPSWSELTKDLINIGRQTIENGSFITTYKLHVYGKFRSHEEASRNQFINLTEKIARTFMDGSYIRPATSCIEQKEVTEFGNVVTWPFSEPGSVEPLEGQCRDENGLSVQGTCHWDFTNGGYLQKPSYNQCKFMVCPRGYVNVNTIYCVSIEPADTWDNGFKRAFRTSKEISLLDALTITEEAGAPSLMYLLAQVLRTYLNESSTWLPVRRLTDHGPIVHVGYMNSNFLWDSHAVDSTYNVSWAPNHPSSSKDCIALDFVSRQLVTSNCGMALPFVSLIDVSELDRALLSSTGNATSLGLIDEFHSECSRLHGLAPAYNTEVKTCIVKYSEKPFNWEEAHKLCNGHLPQPGKGFMNWIYEKLLMDDRSQAIYIAIGNDDKSVKVDDSSIDYKKWKPNTNIHNRFGVLEQNGWSLINGSDQAVASVYCEKHVVDTSDNKLSLYFSQNTSRIRVGISGIRTGELDTFRCYKNGRPIPARIHLLPEGDAEIVMGEDSFFGYYFCSVWKRNPLKWIKSNTVLITPMSNNSIYVVKLLDSQTIYKPQYHDNTYAAEQANARCQRKLSQEMEQNDLGFLTGQLSFREPDSSNTGNYEYVYIFQENKERRMAENDLVQYFEEDFSGYLRNSNCSVMEIRNTDGCRPSIYWDSTQKRNLHFVATSGSGEFLTEELCVTENGEPVTRICHGDFIQGYYWSPILIGSCSSSTSTVTQQLYNISKNPDLYQNGDLATITVDGESLLPVDIHFVSSSFHSLAQFRERQNMSTNLKLNDLVSTMNNVLSAQKTNFELLQQRLNTTNMLLKSFEDLSFQVQMDDGYSESINNVSKSLISAERLDILSGSPVIGYSAKSVNQIEKTATLRLGDYKGQEGVMAEIVLPSTLTRTVARSLNPFITDGGEAKVQLSFVVYRTGKLFLPPPTDDLNYYLNSYVIQASYHGYNVRNLNESDPVKLTFKPLHGSNDTICAYWDFEKNDQKGGWSTDGCWKQQEEEDSLIVCNCNHLTSFALLINYDNIELDAKHALILQTISTIGCCLSIFGLLMVFLTFCLFKKWRRSLTNKILLNLSIAVFFSMSIFLGGINQTQNLILCRSVAVSLHYFILASFGWMLVEGVHQYLKFVKVLSIYIPRFLWKASICAWGLPFVPIVCLLVYDGAMYDSQDQYSTGTLICWISPTGFKYAFLPPLVLTMAVNLVMYSMIINGAVCKRTRISSTISDRDLMINQFSMAVCVFFLLGFTWIFGLLAITGARLVFSYLFSIFNTLQGFFIFVFHVCRERSVRRQWAAFFSIIGRRPGETSSGSYVTPSLNSRNYSGARNTATRNNNTKSQEMVGKGNHVVFTQRGIVQKTSNGSPVTCTERVSLVSTQTHSTPLNSLS